MRAIKDKINEEREKSIRLTDIAMDKKVPFKKSLEIKKKRDKHYDKFIFFKNLNEAMEEKK